MPHASVCAAAKAGTRLEVALARYGVAGVTSQNITGGFEKHQEFQDPLDDSDCYSGAMCAFTGSRCTEASYAQVVDKLVGYKTTLSERIHP